MPACPPSRSSSKPPSTGRRPRSATRTCRAARGDRGRRAGLLRGGRGRHPQPHRSARAHRGGGGRALPRGVARRAGRRPDALLYPTVHFGPPMSYEHLPLSPRAGCSASACATRGRSTSAGPTTGACRPAGSSTATRSTSSPGCSRSARSSGSGRAWPSTSRDSCAPRWRGGGPAGSRRAPWSSCTSRPNRACSARRSASRRPRPPSTPTSSCSKAATCRGPSRRSAGDVVATEVAPLALERGGHLHLGLEFYGGAAHPTNVELVSEAVALCEKAGRPVPRPIRPPPSSACPGPAPREPPRRSYPGSSSLPAGISPR